MAGYIGNKSSVVSSGAERKFKFTITETTTTLSNIVYTPTLVHVFHNGVRLVDGTDYTATNGTSITLNNAAENGDEVVVVSYASFQTSDTVSASAGGTFGGNITINADLTVSGNTDINGGTIDGTVIGGSTPAAISGTTGTFSSDMTGTDLYLSGGVYLGGTGSANYLDDYETGTWTPVISGGTSAGTGTYTLQSASYVKVGKMVSVVVRIEWTAHTGTGTMIIPSFPFTTSSDNQAAFAIMHRNLNIGGSNKTALFYIGTSSTTGTVLGVEDNVNWTNPSMDSAGSIIFSGTYEAA